MVPYFGTLPSILVLAFSKVLCLYIHIIHILTMYSSILYMIYIPYSVLGAIPLYIIQIIYTNFFKEYTQLFFSGLWCPLCMYVVNEIIILSFYTEIQQCTYLWADQTRASFQKVKHFTIKQASSFFWSSLFSLQNTPKVWLILAIMLWQVA